MTRTTIPKLLFLLAILVPALSPRTICAESWPPLPNTNGEVTIPAQAWPAQPGPRSITIHIRYPQGRLESVNPDTGLMLSLHYWGGTAFRGAPDPGVLTTRYDVVAIGVDYLQSGPYDPDRDPPYDFGYYQALDALRGLYFVWQGLDAKEIPFNHTRIYATGGSGGGNVSLMVNKLAPRTFACVVDLSGMAKLAGDIAFGQPGRTHLNAGYSRDPQSDRYLSTDGQTLRFVGFPDHAAAMKRLGNEAKLIVVHGEDDIACPVEDAKEMVENMQHAGLDVDAHFISESDVDGEIFKDSGHALGDRTRILQHVADNLLLPGASSATRTGKSDFDHRDEKVVYPTPNGSYIISYTQGHPIARFEQNKTIQ